MTFIPNREELAWAGGFFTGEGSVCLSREKGYRKIRTVRIDVTQVERAPLERWITATGIGTIYGPRLHSKNGRSKPISNVAVQSFEKTQAVIAMLWEFLSPAKQAQAARALSLYRSAPPRTHCKHGHEFTPENTYTRIYRGLTRRQCRQCVLDRSRVRNERLREAKRA